MHLLRSVHLRGMWVVSGGTLLSKGLERGLAKLVKTGYVPTGCQVLFSSLTHTHWCQRLQMPLARGGTEM